MSLNPIAVEESKRLGGHQRGVARLELHDDLHHFRLCLAGYPPNRRWPPPPLRALCGPRFPTPAPPPFATRTSRRLGGPTAATRPLRLCTRTAAQGGVGVRGVQWGEPHARAHTSTDGCVTAVLKRDYFILTKNVPHWADIPANHAISTISLIGGTKFDYH